jgi:hypothetical protein
MDCGFGLLASWKGFIFPFLFMRLRFVLLHIMTPDDDSQYPFEHS